MTLDRLWPQSRLVNYLTSSFKLLNPFVWQQKFAKASLKNSASAKYFLAHNAYKTWKWGRIFSFHTYRQEQYMKISLISNQERFKDSNIFRCNCWGVDAGRDRTRSNVTRTKCIFVQQAGDTNYTIKFQTYNPPR